MTSVDSAAAPPQPRWFGHPPGLWVLATTEMWERFSYYGMRGLLTVYMIQQLAFSEERASAIYGWYVGLIYFTPLLGGIVSDRWLGRRRSVIAGGSIMALGHLAMTQEAWLLPALGLIVLGNGLFLPSLGSQVGTLYGPDDPRRKSAYSVYYLGINFGAFIASFVIGTLGTEVGWHWGFGAAGVGLVLGLILYVAGRRWLPPEPPRGIRTAAGETLRFGGLGARLAGLLLAVWGAVIVFRVAYAQQGNSLARWAADGVNRSVGGGREIPFPWFESINPLLVLLLTFPLVAIWTRQEARGRDLSAVKKMALGAAVVGCSYLTLSTLAAMTPEGALTPWAGLAVFFVILTIGELFILPIGLGLFGRLAPDRYRGTMIAAWFSAAFFGSLISGWIGGYFSDLGPTLFFGLMGGVCGVAALLLFALNGPARRAEEGFLETHARPRGSKAGRNEARKLAAAFLNNAGLAFFLASVLQPIIAYVRERQPVTDEIVLGAFLLAAIAATLAASAQIIGRRLED